MLQFQTNIKSSLNVAVDYFTDGQPTLKNVPKISLPAKIWHTLRYRLAAKGLHLTNNERRLSKFENIHNGQRAFVLGNGPSLNKCDLSYLKQEITFGVNSIYLNYDNMGFYPTYYVVEDVFVAEDRKKEINQFNKSVKFFGNYLKYCLDDTGRTIWLNVIVRYDDYKNFPNFSTNAARLIWVGGTVTYICLQLAYYMGFHEIFLIGFDHTYSIPENAIISGTKIVSTSDDVNHFCAEYFGKGYRWHLPEVQRMEKAYIKAKQYFEKDNRKIYNATAGGQLEVFERVDYQSLFND
jgi:hypothetical protein